MDHSSDLMNWNKQNQNMKEVIVRLGNGLGNQLFTYAAAYSFAKKKKAKLAGKRMQSKF